MSKRAFRLPPYVRPHGYEVDIQTDPAQTNFTGTVRMQLDVREPTAKIVMHARQLTLSDAVIICGGVQQQR